MSTRIPRKLDPVEVRVLGSLLEKEQTNPETVPMTVNALIAACNQKTNREPVMQLTEHQVVTALDWMRQEVLAGRTEGARPARRAARLVGGGAERGGGPRPRSAPPPPSPPRGEPGGPPRRGAAGGEPLVVE